MTVGDRIRNRREELGMTMEDLADKLGVKRWTVNKYEKDIIDMKLSTIKALHEVLSISYIDLLDDDESEDREIMTAYHQASYEKQETVRATLRLPEKEKNQAHEASVG